MNDTEEIEIIDDEHADTMIDLGCDDDDPYQK